MNQNLKKEFIIFLSDEFGLKQSSIELVLKLSKRKNKPVPILLWSYGLLNIKELDKLYSFLFQKH